MDTRDIIKHLFWVWGKHKAKDIRNKAEWNIASINVQWAINELDVNKQELSEKWQVNWYASLDGGGKVPTSELPTSVLWDVSYQGTWNANTNTPTLTTWTGTKWFYYTVSVAWSTDLDWITDWNVWDMAIFNGTVWEIIDNTDKVTSVLWRTGDVVAETSDYDAIQIDNTPAWNIASTDVQGAINELDTEKQETLVNQVNIKSINGDSVLWSGNLDIAAWSWGYAANVYFTDLVSSTVWTYKQVSYTPDALQTSISATVNANEVLMEDYIFDWDVNTTIMPAGQWNFNFFRFVDNNAQITTIRFEIFAREAGGTENVLFSVTSGDINDTTSTIETIQYTQSTSIPVNETDRIWVKVYASTTRTTNTLVTMQVWDWEASYFTTPLEIRHNQLRARDAEDSHPINAITGLQTALDWKVSKTGDTMTGNLWIKTASVNYGSLVVNSTSDTWKTLFWDSFQAVPTTEDVGAVYTNTNWINIEAYNAWYKNILLWPSGGNVGIGLTTPTVKAHIRWVSSWISSDWDILKLDTWDVNANQLAFWVDDVNEFAWIRSLKNGSELPLILNNGGAVGINTSTPATDDADAKVVVGGRLSQVANDANLNFKLKNTGTGGRIWQLLTSSNGTGVINNGFFAIRDETANAQRLTISDWGKVDIGTNFATFDPINQRIGLGAFTNTSTQTDRVAIRRQAGDDNVLGLYRDSAAAGWAFDVENSATGRLDINKVWEGTTWTKMSILDNGNVGIWVVPVTKFQVKDGQVFVDAWATGWASQVLHDLWASSGGNFWQITNTGARWSLGYWASLSAVWTEVLTWNTSWNVGIGTTDFTIYDSDWGAWFSSAINLQTKSNDSWITVRSAWTSVELSLDSVNTNWKRIRHGAIDIESIIDTAWNENNTLNFFKQIDWTLTKVWLFNESWDFLVNTTTELPNATTDHKLQVDWFLLHELGWRDLVSPFASTSPGGSAPTLVTQANGVRLFRFGAGDSVHTSYHVDHDYAEWTLAYHHVHWFPETAMNAGDTVTWRISYVVAKWHNQWESLLATRTSFDVTYTSPAGGTVAGDHIVSEASDLQAYDLKEADTVILAEIELLSKTFAGNVTWIQADLHYQTDREATIGKKPDFNVPD